MVKNTVKLGRPRPIETIERDRNILTLLRDGPLSRNQICERTNLPGMKVWLSLDRLRKTGQVKLCQGIGERIWTVDVDNHCP